MGEDSRVVVHSLNQSHEASLKVNMQTGLESCLPSSLDEVPKPAKTMFDMSWAVLCGNKDQADLDRVDYDV